MLWLREWFRIMACDRFDLNWRLVSSMRKIAMTVSIRNHQWLSAISKQRITTVGSPLLYAAEQGHKAVVRLLLDIGMADVTSV